MTFTERGKSESLAEHLLRNAHALGADRGQISRLLCAFRLAQGSNAERTEGGRMAVEVRAELQAALVEVTASALARGESVATFNDAGAKRVKNRDGLANLAETRALDALQAKGGMAFRLCYEASSSGLGSVLGKIGEGRGCGKRAALAARSAAELHRAYMLARLNQMERAVGAAMVDGRELHALRMIAGEGRTVWDVAGPGRRERDAYKAALVRALDAIVKALRITGG